MLVDADVDLEHHHLLLVVLLQDTVYLALDLELVVVAVPDTELEQAPEANPELGQISVDKGRQLVLREEHLQLLVPVVGHVTSDADVDFLHQTVVLLVPVVNVHRLLHLEAHLLHHVECHLSIAMELLQVVVVLVAFT